MLFRSKSAAAAAGRDYRQITIIAVTKTIPPAGIREAVGAGLSDLGENRVQELLEKITILPDNIRWHFIGHLQTNKVKAITGRVHMIHSLDRWSLAVEIQRRAENQAQRVPVLVQLNVAGEASKQGLAVHEAVDFVQEVSKLAALQVCGLMTIAPLVGNAEEVRPIFRELRLVAENLHKMQVPGVEMKYLSKIGRASCRERV